MDNSITTITLHGLRPINDVAEFVKGIRSNRSLSSIFIEERFLVRLCDDDLQSVLDALIQRPALKSLKCSGLKDRSFSALVKAIRKCPHPPPLTRLWIIGLTLLLEQTNSSLEASNSSSLLLSSLVEALSNIPTLQAVNILIIAPEGAAVGSSVNIEFQNQESTIVWEVGVYDDFISCLLSTVFRYNSDRFTNLKVSGADVSGAAARAVSNILSHCDPSSSALDKIQLSLEAMPVEGARQISDVLAHNHSLKELSLQLMNNDDDNYDDGTGNLQSQSSFLIMSCVAKMLQTNTSLEWLQLSRNLFTDRSVIEGALAKSLETNHTLKVLDLTYDTPGRVSVTDKGYNALLDMLKVNQVIELIPTYGLDQDSILRSKIKMWLKLNETGIRRILVSVNTHYIEFIDVLEEQIDDLDCVFHLLSKNPSLFQKENAS